MRGRLTTATAPAVNEYGVPYSELLRRERIASARLLERSRQALEAWHRAYQEPPNSITRRALVRRALELTERCLS